MSDHSMTLEEFNGLPVEEAVRVLERCCGASAWVESVCGRRPLRGRDALFEAAEASFDSLDEDDWLEAFSQHPRIGDVEQLRERFSSTAEWAGEEQESVTVADEATLSALAEGNESYAQRFGWIFIVCATGKSAPEMLALLNARLQNAPEQELAEAAGEQRKITRLRLEKLLRDT